MNFQQQIAVKNIDLKHPEWVCYAPFWDRMALLYDGGVDILKSAADFLMKRPKEQADVFASRVDRFTYHNHVGTSIDYYLAAIFEKPPQIEPSGDRKLAGKDRDFYYKFSEDCDAKNTSLVDKFREILKSLILYRKAYILVDLPPKLGDHASLGAEETSGQLDPLLVLYDPRQAINWQCDKIGRLEWIIFKVRTVETRPMKKPVVSDRWYYFDKTDFAVYYMEVPENGVIEDDSVAELEDSGRHPFSEQGMLPVIQLEIPNGLWLMNRAYLPAIDHLNTENVLSWALTMAALAMPVIISDAQVTPTLTEAGFIQLPIGSSYAWTEPAGTSFEHLARREHSLVEHIFRAFYLVAQARTTDATPAQQSGYSKEQDMAPAKKMLNLFGDLIRASIGAVMNRVSFLRGDKTEWSVTGLEFPEESPQGDVDMITSAMALNIPSDLVEKELYKKVIDSLFPEIKRELRDKMYTEIDAAESREKRAEALMKAAAEPLGKMMEGV